jgi:hypothetical protein
MMWRRDYSLRSAVIGSTLEARQAGMAQATPDTQPSRTRACVYLVMPKNPIGLKTQVLEGLLEETLG